MTRTNNTNICCYMVNTLKEINKVMTQNKFKEESWFAEVFWLKLQKDNKLCQKCL